MINMQEHAKDVFSIPCMMNPAGKQRTEKTRLKSELLKTYDFILEGWLDLTHSARAEIEFKRAELIANSTIEEAEKVMMAREDYDTALNLIKEV